MSQENNERAKSVKRVMVVVGLSLLFFLGVSGFFIFQLHQQLISIDEALSSWGMVLALKLLAASVLLAAVIGAAVFWNIRPLQRELVEAFWQAEESGHEVDYLNRHDSLTGLLNRAYWDEMVLNNIPDLDKFGIMVFVIDSLKLTNDALGYTTGEKVLVACAKCLRACVGEEGMLARISGAEFGVLYPWGDDKYMASIYEKVSQELDERNRAGELAPMHISAGWAVAKGQHDSYENVYTQAYTKMVKGKQLNRHFVSDSIFAVIVEKLKHVDYFEQGHIDNLLALSKEFFEIYTGNVYIENLSVPRFEMLVRYHDIGKVGLREDIHELASFSLEDRLEMDRHVTIGYQVAMYIPHLASIGDLILRHHEWWDGTGSIFAYNKEYIPAECRLFAIIDAYEAMTGVRPHKKPVTTDKALHEINKFAGKQFDPTLARMFSLMLRARE
ncbi:MAG: diguanylate cyclase [Peptococcaceae bacterium]|nr:diguanylate cyclase [Peptococcaceae bacterium]MDR2736015.1 diguanylate cyclase [Gracilibacteraceae bacterium]